MKRSAQAQTNPLDVSIVEGCTIGKQTTSKRKRSYKEHDHSGDLSFESIGSGSCHLEPSSNSAAEKCRSTCEILDGMVDELFGEDDEMVESVFDPPPVDSCDLANSMSMELPAITFS